MPTGAPNGGVIVGTGSAVEAHTLVSGTDWIDAVTIEAWAPGGGAVSPTITWPNTGGTATTVTLTLVANSGVQVLIDQWEGNGGGVVYITGPATTAYKVHVQRHPKGKNEPDPPRQR